MWLKGVSIFLELVCSFSVTDHKNAYFVLDAQLTKISLVIYDASEGGVTTGSFLLIFFPSELEVYLELVQTALSFFFFPSSSCFVTCFKGNVEVIEQPGRVSFGPQANFIVQIEKDLLVQSESTELTFAVFVLSVGQSPASSQMIRMNAS